MILESSMGYVPVLGVDVGLTFISSSSLRQEAYFDS